MDSKEFGSLVVKARELSKLSIDAAADKFGVHPATWNKYEKGHFPGNQALRTRIRLWAETLVPQPPTPVSPPVKLPVQTFGGEFVRRLLSFASSPEKKKELVELLQMASASGLQIKDLLTLLG